MPLSGTISGSLTVIDAYLADIYPIWAISVIWLPWRHSCHSCLGGHVTVIDIYYVRSGLISVRGCTWSQSVIYLRCAAICTFLGARAALCYVVISTLGVCTIGQGLLP